MPKISATVRQPIVDAINVQAKREKRSFSEMVAVLLEKAVYVDHVVTIRGKDILKYISKPATEITGSCEPSDSIQQ